MSVAAAATGDAADDCAAAGVKMQVLGSGADDFVGGRAASGYLVWIDGKARVLVDMGAATAMRFAQSGARAADLEVVLLTQLHADHTADLPALVAAAIRERRMQPLPLYGPSGNRFAPSTVTFVRTLLDNTRGAYRYLGNVLSPLTTDGFKLEAHEVRERKAETIATRARRDSDNGVLAVYATPRLHVSAAHVTHGVYPVLAWGVNVGNRRIVFSGDGNGEGGNLERLAQGADLLIAHHAVAEGVDAGGRYLHMPPSVIGRIAAEARVKRLVLTHRTQQTLAQEEATLAAIRARYAGPVVFADDLSCFSVP